MSNTSGLGRVDSCREPPITLSSNNKLPWLDLSQFFLHSYRLFSGINGLFFWTLDLLSSFWRFSSVFSFWRAVDLFLCHFAISDPTMLSFNPPIRLSCNTLIEALSMPVVTTNWLFRMQASLAV
jgi:uncharacterized membrane protein